MSPPESPSSAERNAIRAAITEGRQTAAVRLLRKASRKSQLKPDSWQWVGESAAAQEVIPIALQLSRRGHYALAAAILAGVESREAPVGQRRSIGRALAYGGQHGSAIRLFKDLMTEPGLNSESYTAEMRFKDAQSLGLSEMHQAANDHVSDVKAPMGAALNGFVVIFNASSPVLTGLMVPLVRPLIRQGYALAAVTGGTLDLRLPGVPEFDWLQGCVAPDAKSLVGASRQKLSQDWRVDWPAGVVEAGGINYYPYFLERLAQRARRYRVDILNDPESAARFTALQLKADVALAMCERLSPLASYNKPIRIALMESHFAPQGVIREWCDRVGRKDDIHAVGLGSGYENYFSNLTSLEAKTLAIEDLTAQPELRQPFLGGSHRMEAFLAENPHLDSEPADDVLSWICQDRSKVGSSARSREHVAGRVDEVRANGGKIFVALGKVSIDFAAPGDRGFVHADFVSWLNHLVQAVSGTENLLLIKPHPHELRKEIVVRGVQLLRELMVPDLPPNVVFLDHDSFNTHELAEFVDVAFLWNGTAALEFSVLGVPVVPASIWADMDYPVGLNILRSREEYEAVLQGSYVLEPADGVRRRAAMFLRVMRSDHVAIPYKYLRRAATNLKVGTPLLDTDELTKLETIPDPFVERAAARFFEFA